MSARCDLCSGEGWLLNSVTYAIERCDACAAFGSDREAAEHVARISADHAASQELAEVAETRRVTARKEENDMTTDKRDVWVVIEQFEDGDLLQNICAVQVFDELEAAVDFANKVIAEKDAASAANTGKDVAVFAYNGGCVSIFRGRRSA